MQQPFWLVELHNDESAVLLASRSITLRCVLELWSHSTQLSQFHEETRRYINDNPSYVANLCDSSKSFKIIVDTYNRRFSQSEKVDKIETFGYLPCKGIVCQSLNNFVFPLDVFVKTLKLFRNS